MTAERGASAPPTRLGLGATLSAAFIVTLARPIAWALGLAGFLAGGGILVLAWPIVALPTPTGLQNALGGPVTSLVFGAPSATLVAILAAGLVLGTGLLLAGCLAGAWAERHGIAVTLEAAADEGLVDTVRDLADAPGWVRIAIIRLLGLVPVLVAALLAWQPVYDAAYRQLVLPDDLATPLPIRLLGEVPGLVVLLALAWWLSDAAGSVAVRRLVLERRSVLGAWLLGWADLVRRPLDIVPIALAGLAALVLVTAPALIAATVGWHRVRDAVVTDRDPVVILVTVLTWVAIWLGALVLAGVGSAFRSALWTLELPRSR